MIIQIEVGWSAQEFFKGMGRSERNTLREHVLAFKELAEPVEGETYYNCNVYGKTVVTDKEFELIQRLKIPVEVKHFKNTYTPETIVADNGAKYHFHLPNIALMMFNKVTWLEDACTQDLQRHLDEGWRMVAVCPPNGVRRPDYILAKTSGEA